jgi:hypothetical protein
MKPESTLLPADWEVPAKFRERLGNAAGRQRMMLEDGQLLLVLHAPPGADDTLRRGRFFWRDASGNWRVAPKGEGIANVDEHLNEYESTIAELEQQEEIARDARGYFQLLDRVNPLVRAVRNMYDSLQEAREKVSDDRRIIVARDKAYELSRRADLLLADATNGLDFAVAWQAEQQAESTYQMAVSTHRLNVLVSFFFPIATLMAIFGATLGHGLEGWDAKNAPIPLLFVLGVGLISGAVLAAFVTRPAKRPKQDIQSNASKSSTRRSK